MVQGWLGVPFAGDAFAPVVVVVCVASAVLGGVMAWAALAALARLLRRPAWRPGGATSFWIGWGTGLAPLAHNLLFLDGGPWLPRLALVAALPLLFLAAAPRLGRLLPPPRPLVAALLLLALASYPLALLIHGPSEPDLGPRAFPADPPKPLDVTVDALHPDLVLVSIDTLRADAILDPAVATPTLDRLRREGAWSPYALASSNQTLPGHAGMLTGAGAAVHGVRSNVGQLPAELPLVSELLAARGWNTAGFVSNGLLRAAAGFGRGWDLYDDAAVAHAGPLRLALERLDRHTVLGWLIPRPRLRMLVVATLLPGYAALDRDNAARGSGARVIERALAALDQLHARPRPAFLFLHLMDTHTPYGAPAPFRGRHTAGLALPSLYAFDRRGRATTTLTAAIQRDLSAADPAVSADARAAAAYVRGMYLEEVEFVDSLLARLLARLEAGGRPTVLLVTSDHGEHFGEHGLMEHANSLYEPLLRVPFVLWGDGVEPRELPPPHLADVVPLLLAGGRSSPATAPLHFARDESHLAARAGTSKWLLHLQPGASEPTHESFTDLATDLTEHDDRGAGSVPPELAAGARAFAAREAARSRAAPATAPSAERRALLRELGYLGELEPEPEPEPEPPPDR